MSTDLKTLAEEANERLADASAQEVLAWARETFGDELVVTASMADGALPHLAAEAAPGVDVLFLDTGYHFAETIGTRDAVESTMELSIVDVTPKRTVAEQDAEFGKDLFSRDPGLCCQMRKVEPLAETLGDYEVWITGVRREDSWLRAGTPVVELGDALIGAIVLRGLRHGELDTEFAHRLADLLLPVRS